MEIKKTKLFGNSSTEIEIYLKLWIGKASNYVISRGNVIWKRQQRENQCQVLREYILPLWTKNAKSQHRWKNSKSFFTVHQQHKSSGKASDSRDKIRLFFTENLQTLPGIYFSVSNLKAFLERTTFLFLIEYKFLVENLFCLHYSFIKENRTVLLSQRELKWPNRTTQQIYALKIWLPTNYFNKSLFTNKSWL